MYNTGKLIFLQKKSEKKLNDLYGLSITEILMNIMSCHDFSKLTTSEVILTFRSAPVPYYLSKGFFIVEK